MSNISLKQSTYLFVDGSNFRQYFNETTQKWFGQEVGFDFKKIKDFFRAEKAFYYDCIDDIKTDSENQQDFESRVDLQEVNLNKIREVEGCHVHLGSLSGKGKKKRQKEVDVLLAVQMMEHAFRGNMSKAILFSGDKDFRPLVESLVRLGLFVEVVGDQNHISSDLIHAADASRKLSIDEYFEFSPNYFQKQMPKDISSQSFFKDRAESEGYWLDRKGIYNDIEILVYTNGQAAYRFTTSNKTLHDNSAWVADNIDYLILYFELKFGQITWK